MILYIKEKRKEFMNLIVIVPKKEELNYRQKIVEDPKTMEYNRKIVLFPKEKWNSWYEKWIGKNDPNFYYAYLFDEDISSYVGEIAYRKDHEKNFVILSILIEHKHRGKGYGREGLKRLVMIAFQNGWEEVRDLIAKDNIKSHKMFLNFGFRIVSYDEEGNIEFSLTKEEFVHKYGEIKSIFR